jgi:hypothetical protein
MALSGIVLVDVSDASNICVTLATIDPSSICELATIFFFFFRNNTQNQKIGRGQFYLIYLWLIGNGGDDNLDYSGQVS